MEEMHYVEQFFIKLKSFYAFTSQVCFFILVDWIISNNEEDIDLQSDKSVVTALTTILFYSVFGYFVTKIRDIFQTNRLSIIRTIQTTDHLSHWICKLILEWAKAVVIVLCLREQGINYEPSLNYSIITFIYYICSEKIFVETFPQIVELFNIECLEDMEHLYIPMFLNAVAIVFGLIASTYIFLIEYSSFVILCMYFLIYIRMKDFYYNYWKLLVLEKQIYTNFRVATSEEILAWSDICAICLNSMSRAKITPCNHLFHPYCLKQCLKSSLLCPLCKSTFIQQSDDDK
ncbi:E3 ubiquitin-protein ligase RNF139-like [Diorhabda carinulata]|uniref:E3 ubiquitin-protein ligase RNF139-like n=1 Tax=Diorhabda carinulata TaxID=1163345 RepID=UPI0025A2D5C0|nr:E3 ubiquitin-protein ligase RNF139-like [Diorhabda carinulata]XP_057665247.1 E3 ubiquitin-protein ligase RNF139-like [Diorhabda carinulata]